jgi:hypothetical protein
MKRATRSIRPPCVVLLKVSPLNTRMKDILWNISPRTKQMVRSVLDLVCVSIAYLSNLSSLTFHLILCVFVCLPLNAGVQLQKTDLAVEGPPTKRRKIRDTNKDAKVESHKCINLTVNKFNILTPSASDNVCYYGRKGTELFIKLVDSHEGLEDFNIEFIGALGTGKSNLAWAIGEHLGTMEDVIWAGPQSNSHDWTVFQFKGGSVYGFDDLSKKLLDILKLDAFKHSDLLIVDAPIDVADAAQANQGPTAYGWASDMTYHQSRRGKRHVFTGSSREERRR